jgi:hypothetical protein
MRISNLLKLVCDEKFIFQKWEKIALHNVRGSFHALFLLGYILIPDVCPCCKCDLCKFKSICPFILYNISAKESSRSDWGSNPRPTATLPSTKYQRSNPLLQEKFSHRQSFNILNYHMWWNQPVVIPYRDRFYFHSHTALVTRTDILWSWSDFAMFLPLFPFQPITNSR